MLPWRGARGDRGVAGGLRLIGVVALLALGLIHLTLAPDYFLQANYIGVLFYAACAGAWATALLVAVGVRGGWAIGAAVAAGTMAGLLLASTVGLPGFTDSLSAPHAVQSLIAEGSFLGAYLLATMARRSPWGV